MNPLTQLDGYKLGHRQQYPSKTTMVFSNFTPRNTRREDYNEGIVFFGLQYFIKEYLAKWKTDFFDKPKDEVIKSYVRRVKGYLGGEVETDHISALHDLGYLPIEIMALPEGSLVPYKVAPLVIFNTKDEFFWLTNYLETILSTVNWLPCTSATTARLFRKTLDYWALKTVGNTDFCAWQSHDFAMRGMGSYEACKTSGGAHLLFFTGTDTVPAIDFLEEYYNADCEKELIGASVMATEHAVMCAGGKEDEIETFRRLINKVCPTGIISIVSDTWDYWQVITEYMVTLKDEIMARDGTVTLRPDSGDPVRIVAGYRNYNKDISNHGVDLNRLYECGFEVVKSEGKWYKICLGKNIDDKCYLEETNLTDAEVKGSIECLWEIFGGKENDLGYKELDSHIKLIYGEAIFLKRMDDIASRLAEKKFASTNVLYGCGSFQYNMCSRDTDGWAMKATACVVDGEFREIFKDPKTDNGMKKSAKGLIAVYEENGTFIQKDQVTWDEVRNCAYKTVFLNGELRVDHTLAEIRARAAATL